MSTPDLLLSVGADLTRLNAQLSELRRTLSGTPLNLGEDFQRNIDRATTGLRSANTSARQLRDGLNQSQSSFVGATQGATQLINQLTRMVQIQSQLQRMQATPANVGEFARAYNTIAQAQERLATGTRLTTNEFAQLNHASALLRAEGQRLTTTFQAQSRVQTETLTSGQRLVQQIENLARNQNTLTDSQRRSIDAHRQQEVALGRVFAGVRNVDAETQKYATTLNDQIRRFSALQSQLQRLQVTPPNTGEFAQAYRTIEEAQRRLFSGTKLTNEEFSNLARSGQLLTSTGNLMTQQFRAQASEFQRNAQGAQSLGQQIEFMARTQSRLTGEQIRSNAQHREQEVMYQRLFRGVDQQNTVMQRLTNTMTQAALAGVKWTATYIAIGTAIGVVTGAARDLLEIDKQLTLIATTLEDNSNKAEILRQSYGLMMKAMTTAGMSAKDAGGLVFELSKAMDGNARLIEAALVPAITLTTLREVDQAQAIRTLVGLYNVFGQSMQNAATPTAQFAAITDQLHNASMLSAGSAKDFLEALRFAAPIAAQANIPMSELLTLLTLMQNSLMAAGQSGTGLSRVLQQLTTDGMKVAEVFEVAVDPDALVNPIELLKKIATEVRQTVEREGGVTIALMEKLKKAFPLIQEERAILTLVQQLQKYDETLQKIEGRTGTTERIFKTLQEAVSVQMVNTWNVFIDQIERFFAALTGTDPGKFEGISTALQNIQSIIKSVGTTAALAAEQVRLWWNILTLPDALLNDVKSGKYEEIPRKFRNIRDIIDPNRNIGEPPLTEEERTQIRESRAYEGTVFNPTGARISEQVRPAEANLEMSSGGNAQSYGELRERLAKQRARQKQVADMEREALLEYRRSTRGVTIEDQLAASQEDVGRSAAKKDAAKKRLDAYPTDDNKKAYEQALREYYGDLKKREDTQHRFNEQRIREEDEWQKHQIEQAAKTLAAQREVSDQRLDILGDEVTKAMAGFDRQADAQVRSLAGSVEDEAEYARITDEIYRIRDLKINEYLRDRLATAHDLLAQWNEEQLKLVGGATRAAEQERQTELSALETWYATQKNLAQGNQDRLVEIERIKALRLFQINADSREKERAAQLADAAAEGRRRANLDIPGLTPEQIESAASIAYVETWEKAYNEAVKLKAGANEKMKAMVMDLANVEREAAIQRTNDAIAAHEKEIKLYAGPNTAMLKYLENGINKQREIYAEQLRMQEAAKEREIQTLEFLNRERERSTQQNIRLMKETAREAGNVFDYLRASFAEAAGVGRSYWDDLATLARDTAQSMQRSLSDFFFDAFTGKLKSASDYFKSFTQSILRSISDLLAQRVVTTFADMILGGAGSSSGRGQNGGGGVLDWLTGLVAGSTGIGGGRGGAAMQCCCPGGGNGGDGGGVIDQAGGIINLAKKAYDLIFGGGTDFWAGTPEETVSAYQDYRAGERNLDLTPGGGFYDDFSSDTASALQSYRAGEINIPAANVDVGPITVGGNELNLGGVDLSSLMSPGGSVLAPSAGTSAGGGFDWTTLGQIDTAGLGVGPMAGVDTAIAAKDWSNFMTDAESRAAASGMEAAAGMSDFRMLGGEAQDAAASTAAATASVTSSLKQVGSVLGAAGSIYSLYNALTADEFNAGTGIQAASGAVNLATQLSKVPMIASSVPGLSSIAAPSSALGGMSGLGAAGAALGLASGAYQLAQGDVGGGAVSLGLAGLQLAPVVVDAIAGIAAATGAAGAGAAAGTAAVSGASAATGIAGVSVGTAMAGAGLLLAFAMSLPSIINAIAPDWMNSPPFGAKTMTEAKSIATGNAAIQAFERYINEAASIGDVLSILATQWAPHGELVISQTQLGQGPHWGGLGQGEDGEGVPLPGDKAYMDFLSAVAALSQQGRLTEIPPDIYKQFVDGLSVQFGQTGLLAEEPNLTDKLRRKFISFLPGASQTAAAASFSTAAPAGQSAAEAAIAMNPDYNQASAWFREAHINGFVQIPTVASEFRDPSATQLTYEQLKQMFPNWYQIWYAQEFGLPPTGLPLNFYSDNPMGGPYPLYSEPAGGEALGGLVSGPGNFSPQWPGGYPPWLWSHGPGYGMPADVNPWENSGIDPRTMFPDWTPPEGSRFAPPTQAGAPFAVVPRPPSGSPDTLNRWLQPGEIVIRKPVAQRYYSRLLHLNATGQWPGESWHGMNMGGLALQRSLEPGRIGYEYGFFPGLDSLVPPPNSYSNSSISGGNNVGPFAITVNINGGGGSGGLSEREIADSARRGVREALRNLTDEEGAELLRNLHRTNSKKDMRLLPRVGKSVGRYRV